MRVKRCVVVAWLAILVAGFATPEQANAGGIYQILSSDSLVPAGLGVGDTFHIIFVTHGSTTAASSDIADYDHVAQIQANGFGSVLDRPGLSWKAVVSTSTVNAKDHTAVSAAVYLTTGVLVANGFSDLWDGTIAHEVNINQLGTPELGFGGAVFTGSTIVGTVSNPLGTSPTTYGRYYATSGAWMADGAIDPANSIPIYAISELLQVASPSSVPEPSTAVLAGFGIVVGIGLRRRFQAKM
ncbi:MAG: PEP-CTERM sorting domain-containing protein [Planctomycetota bacterium]|nr:PEP-CTERM sorting domain-containing protein [Planctomycetota bacterium]